MVEGLKEDDSVEHMRLECEEVCLASSRRWSSNFGWRHHQAHHWQAGGAIPGAMRRSTHIVWKAVWWKAVPSMGKIWGARPLGGMRAAKEAALEPAKEYNCTEFSADDDARLARLVGERGLGCWAELALELQ